MKAILEFNLPEEETDHYLALNGIKYAICLEELDNHCRSKLKYEELTNEAKMIYQEIRNRIHDELEQRDLQLYP